MMPNWVASQTRLSAEFVAELEGVLSEHEGDLEQNVQRSPKPGQAGPTFPAMVIHKLINQHILVCSPSCMLCKGQMAAFKWGQIMLLRRNIPLPNS